MKRLWLKAAMTLLAIHLSHADAPDSKMPPPPEVIQSEDTSRFERSPWIKRIDLQKTGDLLRVIVKASAATECYKQREIERVFEKNIVKIILRLKKNQKTKGCSPALFDYEEKVFESTLEQAPSQIWILGYEGWHKIKVEQ